MDLIPLPEQRDINSLLAGWERPAMIPPVLSGRCTGHAGVGGCIQSPSQPNGLYTAVCTCSCRWLQLSVPHGDERCEDGLNNGSIKLLHYCLLQLPQEIHPLQGFGHDGADVHFSLRSWVMMQPRNQKDSTMSTGELSWVTGEFGSVLSEVHNHLHCLPCVEHLLVLAAPGSISSLQLTSSPSATSPTRVVPSANFRILTNWWLEVHRLVYNKKRRERMQPRETESGCFVLKKQKNKFHLHRYLQNRTEV